MKRKLFTGAIAAVCLFAIVGCGGNGGGNGENNGGDPPEPPADTRQEVDLKTLCGELGSSYYSKNLKCGEPSGLSDPSLVGANESKMNEERYPVPATVEHTYLASEHKILPENNNNTAALNALLSSLKSVEGSKKIVFPAGVYRFSDTVTLTGLSDLYFVGEGTTEFVMNNWTVAVRMQDCSGVHFNHIDFDYAVSPTVTGVVQAADEAARTVTIAVNEGFDMSHYLYNGGKINYGNYMEFVKDDVTGDYYPDDSGMLRYNSTGDRVNMITDGKYDKQSNTLTLTFGQGWYKKPAAGKVVSVGYTMYEYYTFEMRACKNYYMEDCNIYTSAGMTFGFYSSENIYLNRTNLRLREGSNRLMTATADGLHTNDCYGDLIVSNSLYENSHDDSINVCTFYKTVQSASGKTITCAAPNAAANFPTEVGDKLEIYNSAMEVMASYTVESVESYGLIYEITVDGSTRKIKEGYLVGNLTRTPKFVAENCVFRNKRNRGILCQTQNSEIRNCTFYNVIHGAINLHSSFDGFFNEGLIPRDVTVKNCKFVNNHSSAGTDVDVFRNGGTIAPDTIRNITIENNYFESNMGQNVRFLGAGSCTVKNNLCYNGARSASSFYLAKIEKSDRISVIDNFVYFRYEKSGWQYLNEIDASKTEFHGNGVKNAAVAE